MASETKCPASIIVTNIKSSNQNFKKYVNNVSQLNVTWTLIGITDIFKYVFIIRAIIIDLGGYFIY